MKTIPLGTNVTWAIVMVVVVALILIGVVVIFAPDQAGVVIGIVTSILAGISSIVVLLINRNVNAVGERVDGVEKTVGAVARRSGVDDEGL